MFVQRCLSTIAVLLGQSARITRRAARGLFVQGRWCVERRLCVQRGLRVQNFHARDAVALHLFHHERTPVMHHRLPGRRDIAQLMQEESGQCLESGVAWQLDVISRHGLDSAEKIEALLDAASALDARAKLKGGRDQKGGLEYRRALLATFLFAGLRIGELTDLRWRDVDLDAASLRVESGAPTFAIISRSRSKKRFTARPQPFACRLRSRAKPAPAPGRAPVRVR